MYHCSKKYYFVNTLLSLAMNANRTGYRLLSFSLSETIHRTLPTHQYSAKL